jgi:two-component system phosphate regulon sensor histidine kinase PhoR
LRNLVVNAVKFRSRQRPLFLKLSAAGQGDRVEIRLEDNGVGMDPESARQAFEPYYRGTNEREAPGHGLGLAIVRKATQALGGSCELTSEIDRGTTIAVSLPRVVENALR